MSSTLVVVAHPDERVRAALTDHLEREAGLVVAAATAEVEPSAWPGAVVVAGGDALTTVGGDRAVVAIAEGDPVRAARRALRAAATDLLAWPEERERLGASVRRAAVRLVPGAADAMLRVVAVAGARGGLGTTTLAAWTAQALGAGRLVAIGRPCGLDGWASHGVGDLDDALRVGSLDALSLAGRASSFEVPVLQSPGLDLDRQRQVLELLERDEATTVADLGVRGECARELWRRASTRILLVGDDVGSVRQARSTTPLDRWVLRRMRRSGPRRRDLAEALGSEPLATIVTRSAVARATDLGRLASPPRGLVRAFEEFAPRSERAR